MPKVWLPRIRFAGWVLWRQTFANSERWIWFSVIGDLANNASEVGIPCLTRPSGHTPYWKGDHYNRRLSLSVKIFYVSDRAC
jgi:hypothetical protein